nr:MAG TPA: hypothetical protein [Caudoviricetes sp.]
MDIKTIAESYFNRITYGHRNAVKRPNKLLVDHEKIDRELRKLIEKANHNGDCIINVGNGYYRPVKSDLIDDFEYKQYKKIGISVREKSELKERSMDTAYNNWDKEGNRHGKRETEGCSRGAGAYKVS